MNDLKELIAELRDLLTGAEATAEVAWAHSEYWKAKAQAAETTIADLQARVGEEAAKRENAEGDAELFRYMLSVAEANGFGSLTDAITRAQAAEARVGELEGALPAISLDGPNKITNHRLWLARQLLDSKLTDAEAYKIVAHSPAFSQPLRGLVEVEGRSEEGGVTSVPPAGQNDVTDAASHTGASRARLSRTTQEPPSPDNLNTGKEG